MNIPAPTQGAGSIPEIEDGLYVGRFNDIVVRVVEAFKTDKDAFGHPDDGTRYDFNTTVLNDERQPVMLVDVKEGADDPTEEFTLRQAKSVRAITAGEKSNCFAYLKGILTPVEMQLFQAAGKGDEQADAMWSAAAEKVNRREVNIQVSHNDKGWPQIETFVGPAKPLKVTAK